MAVWYSPGLGVAVRPLTASSSLHFLRDVRGSAVAVCPVNGYHFFRGLLKLDEAHGMVLSDLRGSAEVAQFNEESAADNDAARFLD